MSECTLATIWCFMISYTLLTGPPLGGASGGDVAPKQETIDFETEGACRSLETYYAPLIGQPLYGALTPHHRARLLPMSRHTTQFTMVVQWAECSQMGRLQ